MSDCRFGVSPVNYPSKSLARVDRKGVTEAPVICLDGRFRCLYAEIHGVVQNQLFSAVSAWNGDLYALLPAVFGFGTGGTQGCLESGPYGAGIEASVLGRELSVLRPV